MHSPAVQLGVKGNEEFSLEALSTHRNYSKDCNQDRNFNNAACDQKPRAAGSAVVVFHAFSPR
jgi:hypothetical protein